MKFDGMNFRHTRVYGYRHTGEGANVEFYRIKTGETVPMSGRSLTNMIYAEDGRVFLAYDGAVYTAGKRKR